MSGKIKAPKEYNKINGKSTSSQGCCSEQFPWVSFRYMTANSKHTIDYFSPGSDRNETLSSLYAKLEEITQHTWNYWLQRPKTTGMETIKYHELFFDANSDAKISKDTDVFIVRFDTYRGPKKGRIIGYKSSPCAAFHIIGYDFDFSAYKH